MGTRDTSRSRAGALQNNGRKVESHATIVVITTVACKKTGRAQTRLELKDVYVSIRDRDWHGQTSTGASQERRGDMAHRKGQWAMRASSRAR